jgi:hypothetical protein
MSEIAAKPGTDTAPAPVVSAGELLPWVAFAGLLLMLLVYFVGGEEGALSIVNGTVVHEFVHDARHLLGFPCH